MSTTSPESEKSDKIKRKSAQNSVLRPSMYLVVLDFSNVMDLHYTTVFCFPLISLCKYRSVMVVSSIVLPKQVVIRHKLIAAINSNLRGFSKDCQGICFNQPFQMRNLNGMLIAAMLMKKRQSLGSKLLTSSTTRDVICQKKKKLFKCTKINDPYERNKF